MVQSRPSSMSREIYDAIVVGLGVMGSASLRGLAQEGLKVLGIDRFAPPHDRGSTFGETRATRLAVGEGDVYVPLVRRSHEVWRELEERNGSRLLDQCGFLTIDSNEGTTELHGMGGFVDRTVDMAGRHGITHELLAGADIRARFPAFIPPDDARGYFEPEGSLVHTESAVTELLADAANAGATVITGEAYLSHREDGAGVALVTDRARYLAQTVVLAAGPWLPELAQNTLAKVRRYPQQLHWVAPTDRAAFDPANCPVYLWLHGQGAEDIFYGFPEVTPQGGVKVATEQYSFADENASTSAPKARDARDAMIARHLAGRFASSVHGLCSAGCRYTVTPDSHFVIDRLPEDQRVMIISAFSGHGFKHAPAIGELIEQMVLSDLPPPPEFAIDRPALRTGSTNGAAENE